MYSAGYMMTMLMETFVSQSQSVYVSTCRTMISLRVSMQPHVKAPLGYGSTRHRGNTMYSWVPHVVLSAVVVLLFVQVY